MRHPTSPETARYSRAERRISRGSRVQPQSLSVIAKLPAEFVIADSKRQTAFLIQCSTGCRLTNYARPSSVAQAGNKPWLLPARRKYRQWQPPGGVASSSAHRGSTRAIAGGYLGAGPSVLASE